MRVLLAEYLGLLEGAVDDELVTHNFDVSSVTDEDTLLVVDVQHDFLPGGNFGVAEGHSILPGMCALVRKFASKGATVIATRDYHPLDHCSFSTHGGPFPPHCVQGTLGSHLHEDLVKTLQPLLADENTKQHVHVVYKAFSPDIDSFGSFAYSDEDAGDRLSVRKECGKETCHCSVDWTGAFVLFSSNLANDANAPPDVMSVLSRKPLSSVIPEDGGRMFICGLAMDYCVIDSAVNFAQSDVSKGKEGTYILSNFTRAAHILEVGEHGSGFLTCPKSFMKKMRENGIELANFEGYD